MSDLVQDKKQGLVYVSAGEIPGHYAVIGLVFGFGSNANPVTAYQLATDSLKQAALQTGANSLLHVNFQNRIATSTSRGCFGETTVQVLEVFAWGTAVMAKY